MAQLEFDFLILCGGQGHRVQGQDKPLLHYRGQPMVASVATTAPPGTQILISANRNLETYQRWGTTFIDSATPFGGPLDGVLGGLDRCESEWLLVSPGDTPCLGNDWFEPLLEGANEFGAVIHDGMQQQNLHLLLHTSLAENLRAYLAQGGFRVWAWLAEVNLAVCSTDHPEYFKNLNTQADLDN